MERVRPPLWQILLLFVVLAPAALIPNGSAIALGIVVLTLLLVKSSRGPTLAFKKADWPRWAAIGIGAGVVLWALSHFLLDPFLGRLFGNIDLSTFAAVKGNIKNYLALLALGIVYGAIIEELVFRGFIIGWGTQLLGERATIFLLLLSTLVFGLGHLYQSWSGVISTGVTGLVFGAIYLAAGRNLLPAMLAHAIFDTIGITMLYFGYSA